MGEDWREESMEGKIDIGGATRVQDWGQGVGEVTRVGDIARVLGHCQGEECDQG